MKLLALNLSRVCTWKTVGYGAVALAILSSSAPSAYGKFGFRHKKYESPITKDTEQPDKILFDKAINDLEHGRYELARIQLQTLINTYDSSEFLAKAKLAVGDSWYREGGMRGFSQAEAEYKDYILFYPTMEESAEAQKKICGIHYQQMDKADRDTNQALRAEQECKQFKTQFPNSKFIPEVDQMLRNTQEVLADSEMTTGMFYMKRGSYNAGSNRLGGVADQYPLYSKADEALWFDGQALNKLGPNFRRQESNALVRIVRDYPLSKYADGAKARLKALEVTVPEPDQAAAARMKYELDHRERPGLMSRTFSFMRRGPDTWTAAKTGTPQMKQPVKNLPPLTPSVGPNAGFTGDVTIAPNTDPNALDKNPDARQPQPAPAK
ncbi:MAG: outer membrane protein assembly factor BamD [Acidobacteriota bacterium]